MTPEGPLHVQVAEAIKWNGGGPFRELVHTYPGRYCLASDDGRPWTEYHGLVPRFDLSWNDTGPLIERFGLMVWRVNNEHGEMNWLHTPETAWRATHATCCEPGLGAEEGPAPLIAVCKLIVSLAAAGKLCA